MKKGLIILVIISMIISMIIYFYTKNNDINIVSLGDGVALGMTPYNIEGYNYSYYLEEEYKSKYEIVNYYNFAGFGKTLKELIYEIKENKAISIKNEKIELQRAINDADILIICIGMDELSEDKITKQIINDYQKDITELLTIIKKLNPKKVIILGLYTIKKEELLNIQKINSIINDISTRRNFVYIDISAMLMDKKYYFNKSSYYINYIGHQEIYRMITKVI